MAKVEKIEREVQQLSPEELAAFRRWFQEFDAAAWDEQLERDAGEGKLDDIANKAIADHKKGRSSEL